VIVDKRYANPGIDEVTIEATVVNPNEHTLSVKAYPKNEQGIVDSLILYDDGNHDDGLQNDGVWANKWTMPVEETYYSVDVKTKDLAESTERILPDIKRFTTIGPVQLMDANQPYIDAEYDERRQRQKIYLVLFNAGSITTARNVKAVISTEDPRIAQMTTSSFDFGDIAAGTADTSLTYGFIYALGYGPDSTVSDPVKFKIFIYSSNILYWATEIDYVTGLEENSSIVLPLSYSLSQNYPNPFNPSTKIKFTLPKAETVKLQVYNPLGQMVGNMVEDKLQAGSHEFEFNAGHLPSGVYFYRLQTGDYLDVKKMILLK
jgi:hypothetical protein